MKPRSSSDKRKHARFNSLNLLEYTVYEQNGEQVAQGMGRTLNVSHSGIKLETTESLPTDLHVQVHMGIQENMVTVIDGRVVYCQPAGKGIFNAGIEFIELDQRGRMILDKYLELFEKQENRAETSDTNPRTEEHSCE